MFKRQNSVVKIWQLIGGLPGGGVSLPWYPVQPAQWLIRPCTYWLGFEVKRLKITVMMRPNIFKNTCQEGTFLAKAWVSTVHCWRPCTRQLLLSCCYSSDILTK